MAELILPISYNWTRDSEIYQQMAPLGDGYTQDSHTKNSRSNAVNLSAIVQDAVSIASLEQTLINLAGRIKFEWRPTSSYPLESYYCESWNIEWVGESIWKFTARFDSR